MSKGGDRMARATAVELDGYVGLRLMVASGRCARRDRHLALPAGPASSVGDRAGLASSAVGICSRWSHSP